MKRLSFLLFGLLLLLVNLAVPVLLQELNITGLIHLNERNVFIVSGLLGIPVAVAAIYLVYMRSTDAGKVNPFFWIWLLASGISAGCYHVSFLSSHSLNAYVYYISDLICLGIGMYLVFVPSAPHGSEVAISSSLDNSRRVNGIRIGLSSSLRSSEK